MEYFFTDEKKLKELEDADQVIELRAYHTIHGVWKYFTVNDGQIDLAQRNYLMIATLEAYMKIRDYFGASLAVPVYIEVEDGLRLQRALDRERQQKEPKYKELCRRPFEDCCTIFVAKHPVTKPNVDVIRRSEEKLAEAGIEQRFLNINLERTRREIADYIDSFLTGGKSDGFKSQ